MEGFKPGDILSQKHPMPGYKEIGYHIAFDIKMDGKFTWKPRLVANGNETKYVPKCDTYNSVVSRDSLHIALLYTALKNLDILSCDMSNAYLESPCGDKLWTVAGNEYGSLAGTPMQIIWALYGLKYVGNSWHKAPSTTLSNINFEHSRANPDIWLRICTNLIGEKYW